VASVAGRVVVFATGEDRTIVQMPYSDALHRLDQGVLYCQNVKQFHGTPVNGISFIQLMQIQIALIILTFTLTL
jgi:hypothetical protein